MGELTLIYGPAHPDKMSPAYERCLTHLDADDSESFLWLFPTHFQAQLMRRQLLRTSRTGLLTGHLALDLNSFTNVLYSLCPSQRPALPLSAQRLLVEDALAASAANAPYYSRQPERLSRGLTQLFRRLEETGTQPSDLGGTTQRSAELQVLYAAYLERLATNWSGSRERFATVDAHLDHSDARTALPRPRPARTLRLCRNARALFTCAGQATIPRSRIHRAARLRPRGSQFFRPHAPPVRIPPRPRHPRRTQRRRPTPSRRVCRPSLHPQSR